MSSKDFLCRADTLLCHTDSMKRKKKRKVMTQKQYREIWLEELEKFEECLSSNRRAGKRFEEKSHIPLLTGDNHL